MKRFLSALLCFVLILSCCSCSAEKVEKTKESFEKTDYRLLSATDLYKTALEKTVALTSASFLTQVFSGEEELYTVDTRRIREGYDGFSLSREGYEKIYFTDGVLYLESDLGNFSAETSARHAQTYLDTYHHALYDLPLEDLHSLEKEDLTLSFALNNAEKLALYQNAVPVENGVFVPTALVGSVKVNEDGLMEEVSYTVSGSGDDGAEREINFVTKLVAYRSDDIRIAIPGQDYSAIGDLRIPHLLANGKALLSDLPTLQATLLSSETLNAAGGQFSSHLEETFYQTENGDFYLSGQNLKSSPSSPEVSSFRQVLQQGNEKKENEYDVLTGTLLSESVTEKGESPWKTLLEGYLSDLSSLTDMTLEEDPQSLSVSFQVSSVGVKNFLTRIQTAFPESGADLSSASGSGNGVFTLSAKTGTLTAFALSFRAENGSDSVLCQYSVTLDATDSVELPPLQSPTPTTPGMQDEHVHGPTC